MAKSKKPEQLLKYDLLTVVAALIDQEDNADDEGYNTMYPTVIDILDKKDSLPIDRAMEVITTIVNGVTLNILKGIRVTGFTQELASLFQDPTRLVSQNKLNFLHYTLNVYKVFKKQDLFTELAYGSNYFGEVGSTVFLDLKILGCKYIPGYDFFSALAVDSNDNLFSFAPKGELSITDGFTYKVRAKVKAHVIDKYTQNAQVTKLNYVKQLS